MGLHKANTPSYLLEQYAFDTHMLSHSLLEGDDPGDDGSGIKRTPHEADEYEQWGEARVVSG